MSPRGSAELSRSERDYSAAFLPWRLINRLRLPRQEPQSKANYACLCAVHLMEPTTSYMRYACYLLGHKGDSFCLQNRECILAGVRIINPRIQEELV